MPRVFVANLHFEQQIAGDRHNLPNALRQRAAELATCWLPVSEPGDCIWCPLAVPDSWWEQMAAHGLPHVQGITAAAQLPTNAELVPWGWSPEMRRFASELHAQCDAPSEVAVRWANSRWFALELERRLDAGLERERSITSAANLEQALRDFGPDERWVIKAEFSSAARQRVIGTGRTPDANTARWIRNRLSADEWLVFEPWVERIREAGLQWTLPRSGPPILEGIAELLTGPTGNYLGSRFGISAAALEVWQPAIDIQQQALLLLQQIGYFGPVGIDAMLYRATNGTERVRPLQDINARWTMGRLALGWQRMLTAGVWRHGSVQEFSQRASETPNLIRTSPEFVGDQPATIATWLEPA